MELKGFEMATPVTERRCTVEVYEKQGSYSFNYAHTTHIRPTQEAVHAFFLEQWRAGLIDTVKLKIGPQKYSLRFSPDGQVRIENHKPPKRTEPVAPSIFDIRETRSDLFALDEMKVRNFDPKTGILEAEFTSVDQYQSFNRKLADEMAAHQNYALAKHFGHRAGALNDPASLRWIEQGLEQTAAHIRAEGGEEWKASSYDQHALQVSRARKDKIEKFRKAIEALKNAFQNDLGNFFEYCARAIALNPLSFEPHSYRLCIVASLIKIPTMAKMVVDEAYAVSPLRTFNDLTIDLLLRFNIALQNDNQSLQAYMEYFSARFPTDIVVYRMAHSLRLNRGAEIVPDAEHQEKVCGKAFADHLTHGLRSIREGDLKDARAAFSQAELFHISDKRPYLYKALIDLMSGDCQSAVKLIIAAKQTIDWLDEGERLGAANQRMAQLIGKEPTPTSPEKPEITLLKIFIRAWNTKENEKEGFREQWMKMLHSYLASPDADLIWAGFAVDAATELLWDASDSQGRPGALRSLLSLKLQLPSVAFALLKQAGEDVAEYGEYMRVENGNFSVKPTIPCGPLQAPAAISVDLDTFKLKNEPGILREILLRGYHAFSAAYVRCVELEVILNTIEGVNKAEGVLFDGPLLSILMNRIHKEGSSEQKGRLLRWTSSYIEMCPRPQRQTLTDHILRWQLDLPVPYDGDQSLILAAEEWLSLVEHRGLTITGDLGLAFAAWKALRNADRELSNSILEPFYNEWEERLSEGVDLIALRTVCLVRAFLRNPDIMSFMPSILDSAYHKELAHCALSMIAREGVRAPYVVPHVKMPQQDWIELSRLYVGQRREEDDEAYTRRVQKASFARSTDLRQVRHVIDHEIDPDQRDWLFPSMRPDLTQKMGALIEEHVQLHKYRCDKNQFITSDEKPKYTQDEIFINWVIAQTQLIADYSDHQEQAIEDFDAVFPKFPQKARTQFLAELGEKAAKARAYSALKEKTAPVAENHGQRLWQLVKQAADLISTVHSHTRQAADYDMALQNQQEAHFVMKLIYEWSRNAWKGSPQELAEAFHGPESHIWGTGPRIPHFNAGVFKNGTLVNVHLFFEANIDE